MAALQAPLTHIKRRELIHLAAPRDRVFPLFTPLGEKHWAEGWEPQMIYPEDGQPEIGAVFSTGHDGDGSMAWIIVDYAPEQGRIVYARVAPQSHAGLIAVQCAEAPDGSTTATVSYTLTALGEAGIAFLAQLTEAHYRQWMASWEKAINHFLRQGVMLPHH